MRLHQFLFKSNLVLMALAFSLGLAFGCGNEASDRPEDCRTGQYFNSAQRRCLTCPAVIEPICREGCGFRIVTDNRSCPVAECATECDLCEEGHLFSSDTLSCEPAA